MAFEEIIAKLESGDFNTLIGLVETEWLDAKRTPYHLDSEPQKRELAKDVTALANAIGGVIVLGFACERLPTTAGERISVVCEFPVGLVDPGKYTQILADLIHPAPHGVSVRVFESSNGKGVAAIIIDPTQVVEKPYLVGKMLDEQSRSIGSYFGYFERKRDTIPPISIARIQQQLSAGSQWSSIDQRLQSIEANIAAWAKVGPPTRETGITAAVRRDRVMAARAAVGRQEFPLVYYVASSEGPCDFPTLFRSRSERLVRILDNPPHLRQQGFDVWAGEFSEIVRGRSRRNLIPGDRIVELWKDGCFIYVAPGDENFLGWRMGGDDRPIHISNFVLAESVLTFCWLAKFVFEEAAPKPSELCLTVGFDNMTRPSGRPTIRDVAETWLPGGHRREAPDGKVEVYHSVRMEQYDAETVGYALVEAIYHWFGFESQSVPFADTTQSVPRLDAQKLVERQLPTSIP